MTDKEKAKELFEKYKPLCGGYWGGKINKEFAKQSALIAVNEILNVSISYAGKDYDYWEEVKTEIEKL